MSLRLIPLVPFWVVNVIPAFFNMKLGSYIIGTFFGIMPGTFVYVWFAIGVEKIIIEGIEPSFSIFDHPNILGSFIALSLFILLPLILKKRMNKIKQSFSYIIIFLFSYLIYVYPFDVINYLLIDEGLYKVTSIFFTLFIYLIIIFYFKTKNTFFSF